MMVTPEQVEKLSSKAGVTPEEAKAALEAAAGDLLDAVLWLEQRGKRTPTAGGTYSTRTGGETGTIVTAIRPVKGTAGGKSKARPGGHAGWDLWATLRDLVSRSLHNQFEVVRHGCVLLSVPILLLIVLLLAAFWVVVPLMVLGLFFGCRYHVSGCDLGEECINNVMDSVSETAEDIKRNVKNHFGR